MLIINADDWGGWRSATDAALLCYKKRRITSVSAMVFMQDSERAASLAINAGMDIGLHLNFNQSFSDSNCPRTVANRQERIARFLKRSRYALLLYNPFLRKDFRAVYQAQFDEFLRLYGRPPSHFDGHQHMHLCTNMLLDVVIPTGQKVRRSFSFYPGEKSALNRCYRKLVDCWLRNRYRLADHFFSLKQCLDSKRLERVFQLAETRSVELMTHPEKPDEFNELMADGFKDILVGLRTDSYAAL